MDVKVQNALSSIGAIYGIYYGAKKGKGFWVTAGYALVFAISGSLLGTAYNQIKNK